MGEGGEKFKGPSLVPEERAPEEHIIPIEGERELAPEVFEKVMEKVQDINELGTAFCFSIRRIPNDFTRWVE